MMISMIKIKRYTDAKLTLKPSSGGLEQLVTNLSSALFWSSPSPVTTWTNQRSVFWSPTNQREVF